MALVPLHALGRLLAEDNGDGTFTLVVQASGQNGGGGGSGAVEVTNWPATQTVEGEVSISGTVPVSGPLTSAELAAAALATASNQEAAKAVLDNILTELQTLNAALVTANGYLATIADNTGTEA